MYCWCILLQKTCLICFTCPAYFKELHAYFIFKKHILFLIYIDTTERWIVPHVFLIHHSYTFPAFLKMREKFMEHFCEHRQIFVVRVIQSPWSTNSWSLAKKTASMTIGTFNTMNFSLRQSVHTHSLIQYGNGP